MTGTVIPTYERNGKQKMVGHKSNIVKRFGRKYQAVCMKCRWKSVKTSDYGARAEARAHERLTSRDTDKPIAPDVATW